MKTTINTKALQGQMTLDYKVKAVLNSRDYTLHLLLNIGGRITHSDATCEYLHNHPTTEDAMKEALKRASEKWGIQLTKEQLKAA